MSDALRIGLIGYGEVGRILAEDLRAFERMRDLDLGLVVLSVILSALSRSSDTEGRVRDAFAVYRQIHTAVDVGDEAAVRTPEEVLLSGLVHAPEVGAEALAPTIAAALRRVDEALAEVYADVILKEASRALHDALEKQMLEGYEFQSDFMKNLVAKAKAEALASGLAEGRAAGRAEAKALDVLDILEVRGLPVSDEVRARVLACRDVGALDRWLRRAVTAPSALAIFDE
mgnify:CR=1 FL=1